MDVIGDTGESLHVGEITEKIKSIPTWAWVVGGGALLFFLIMGRGGSGSGSGANSEQGVDDVGLGGSSGGDTPPDLNQEVANLFALIRADEAANESWRTQVLDLIRKSSTPSAGGTAGGSGSSAGGGSGAALLPLFQSYRATGTLPSSLTSSPTGTSSATFAAKLGVHTS